MNIGLNDFGTGMVLGIILGMVLMLTFAAGVSLLPEQVRDKMKKQTIMQGHAHYGIGSNGDVEFIWNKRCNEESK